MQGSAPCAVQQERASLHKLSVPPMVLRMYPRQGQVLYARARAMISVKDHGDPPEVLHNFAPQLQHPPKLLLKRVPLALHREKRR